MGRKGMTGKGRRKGKEWRGEEGRGGEGSGRKDMQ